MEQEIQGAQTACSVTCGAAVLSGSFRGFEPTSPDFFSSAKRPESVCAPIVADAPATALTISFDLALHTPEKLWTLENFAK